MTVLVSLYLSGQHTVLLGTNLLHPKFYWTPEITEGLCNYATYWCLQLKASDAHGEEGPLEKYKNCLELLIEALKGGHRKKCRDYKEAAYADKGREDLHVLKNFPSIKEIIQPAVWKAYCILRQLGEKYATGEHTAMTPKDRALANAMIVGAWQCDTFMGRKWEIEHALRVDVAAALDGQIGYILGKQHKTHKTYGDIIKLITAPGLEQALLVYDALPRLGRRVMHVMHVYACLHVYACICTHVCTYMHACICMPNPTQQICSKCHYVMHEV